MDFKRMNLFLGALSSLNLRIRIISWNLPSGTYLCSQGASSGWDATLCLSLEVLGELEPLVGVFSGLLEVVVAGVQWHVTPQGARAPQKGLFGSVPLGAAIQGCFE